MGPQIGMSEEPWATMRGSSCKASSCLLSVRFVLTAEPAETYAK